MPAPSPAPRVRRLRPDEADELRAFYNGLSNDTRRLFRPLGWEAEPEECDVICASTRGSTRYDLVLGSGERIVGWAFLDHLDSAEPHLGIGIAEAFTGQGYGGHLVGVLVAEARRRRRRAITLCHVVGNDPAHRLYASRGFVPTHRSRHDDGLDYVHMRLTL